MASVVSSIIEPNFDAIKAHLTVLFEPCQEEYPNGLIEIRYGPDKPNSHAYFNVRPEGIDEAARFAANRTREGANVYVGVNPRKPGTKGAGEDEDVAISFWHFADLDKDGAVERAGQRLKALPPTLSVTTGTEPHRRPHFYWRLEEPVGNMSAWRDRQRGIAQSLEGDMVINPSRIMRLAGTVNFPPQHKLAKGYRVELTSLKTKFSDERQPVAPEEIANAYPLGVTNSVTSSAESLDGMNTLQAMARTRVADLLDACLRGDEWHNNMVRLVAHLAAIGRTSAEIIAMADHITLPGYTVEQTRNDMVKALAGAREKWLLPEPQDDVEAEEDKREDASAVFETMSLDDVENLPAPTYLIEGILPEKGLTFLYGSPGAGKSFIALDMALRLAYGMDWHGKPTRPTGVLYIAGEGKYGLGKRIKGWRREHGLEGVDAPFKLLPVPVHMLEPQHRQKLMNTIAAASAEMNCKVGFAVIDTVSRSIPGQDENKQDVMSMFIDACTDVQNAMDGSLMGVHHAGKDVDRGLRGSSVLLGGCDASIRVTKQDDIVTLKVEKQKDGEEAQPIYMEMKRQEWAAGLNEPQNTLVPIMKQAAEVNAKEELSYDQCRRGQSMITDRWCQGSPLSHRPETRKDGRYAAVCLSRALGGEVSTWERYILLWLENRVVEVGLADKNTKMKGLRVVDPLA